MSRFNAAERLARWMSVSTVVLLFWALSPPAALATFQQTATGSNSFTAHQLGVPTLSCGALGILSATLGWTAQADISQADVYGTGFLASGYELAWGTAAAGPYSTTTAVAGTSSAETLLAGDRYYVVRTVKQSWKGVLSNVVHLHAVVATITTCS